MKHKTKSKKQRQKWWRELSQEKKLAYLEKQAKKRQMRNAAKSDMIMKKMNLSFDCKQCIHGITKSCKKKKNGCIYFYDAINEKYGPAYKLRKTA